jgi:spore germination protein GerM
VPPGTRLRQIYVLEDGTAYVDFSVDLRDGISGGSMEEILTVYSIVDSVALNVPEIQRVGILINGEPVESLNGHLDLRYPLSPDLSLIVDAEAFEEPPPPSPRRRPSILAVGPEPI